MLQIAKYASTGIRFYALSPVSGPIFWSDLFIVLQKARQSMYQPWWTRQTTKIGCVLLKMNCAPCKTTDNARYAWREIKIWCFYVDTEPARSVLRDWRFVISAGYLFRIEYKFSELTCSKLLRNSWNLPFIQVVRITLSFEHKLR